MWSLWVQSSVWTINFIMNKILKTGLGQYNSEWLKDKRLKTRKTNWCIMNKTINPARIDNALQNLICGENNVTCIVFYRFATPLQPSFASTTFKLTVITRLLHSATIVFTVLSQHICLSYLWLTIWVDLLGVLVLASSLFRSSNKRFSRCFFF